MAFISLGRIDKNIIPILIGCVFCFLDRVIEKYGEPSLSKNHVYTNICFSIERFLNIIPFIILKKRDKQTKKIDFKNNNDSIKLIYNNFENNISGKWQFVVLASVIYFFQAIIFIHIFKIKTSFWIFYILITPIFDYLIYKVKNNKHNYVCIVLLLSIGLIIDLVLKNFQKDIYYSLFVFLMDFLREILFSLHNVIVKYVMEKKYVSVYEYSFYNSLINFVLAGIFIIFDYYYIKENDYGNFFISLQIQDILFLLGVTCTQFFVNLSFLFTIKTSSPCHTFIMYAFGHFAYFEYNDYTILVYWTYINFNFIFNI